MKTGMTQLQRTTRWATGTASVVTLLAGVLLVAPGAQAQTETPPDPLVQEMEAPATSVAPDVLDPAVISELVSAATMPGATGGSGIGDYNHGAGYYKGTMVQDGATFICGSKGVSVPRGPLVAHGAQGAAFINANLHSAWGDKPQLTDNQVAGLSRVQAENAQKGPLEAAAVEYAQHAVMFPGVWRDLNGVQRGSMAEMIAADAAMPQLNQTANLATIQALAAEYVDIINSTKASTPIDGAGKLTFADGADQYTKTVKVDATTGATGTVTLTGAVFADTGLATRQVTAGQTLIVKVTAPAGQSATVEVSGTADMTVGTAGYAAQMNVWLPKEGVNEQAGLGVGPAVSESKFTAAGKATAKITVTSVPLVRTGADDLAAAPTAVPVVGSLGLAVTAGSH